MKIYRQEDLEAYNNKDLLSIYVLQALYIEQGFCEEVVSNYELIGEEVIRRMGE